MDEATQKQMEAERRSYLYARTVLWFVCLGLMTIIAGVNSLWYFIPDVLLDRENQCSGAAAVIVPTGMLVLALSILLGNAMACGAAARRLFRERKWND